MTTTTASAQSLVNRTEPGFGATLRSEWTKIRSVRSTWIIVMLAIVLSIGTSALVSIAIGATTNSWEDLGSGLSDPVSSSMTGMPFRLILLIVLGVTFVTSEYSSGMIQSTFIVNPRRLHVLAAKAVIVGILGMMVGTITVFGMFLVSQPIFAYHGLETASITDSDATRHLIVYALVQATVYTMIPFSIAWLLRGTATAITVSLGFLLLPFNLASIVPTWVQANVFRYTPDVATSSLAGYTESVGAAMYLDQTPAIAVVAIWLIGSLIAAAVVLNRRDV